MINWKEIVNLHIALAIIFIPNGVMCIALYFALHSKHEILYGFLWLGILLELNLLLASIFTDD